MKKRFYEKMEINQMKKECSLNMQILIGQSIIIKFLTFFYSTKWN